MPENLSERRIQAVRLRLDGLTVAETADRTGLSAPTVSSAWKAFRKGGWEGVPVRPRGRKAGQAESLDAPAQQWLVELLLSQPPGEDPLWSSRALAEALNEKKGKNKGDLSPRAIDHWLEARDLKPEPLTLSGMERKNNRLGRWYRQQVKPLLAEVRHAGGSVWQGGVRVAKPAEASPDLPRYQLYLHGKRGVLHTRCLSAPPAVEDYLVLFQRLLERAPGAPVALVFHGAWFQAAPEIERWLERHPLFRLLPYPIM
ncbi:MAG: helix-turn-helix domain-containing protein [Pseudomonadota bacterium]